jgi:hypothetical protein
MFLVLKSCYLFYFSILVFAFLILLFFVFNPAFQIGILVFNLARPDFNKLKENAGASDKLLEVGAEQTMVWRV